MERKVHLVRHTLDTPCSSLTLSSCSAPPSLVVQISTETSESQHVHKHSKTFFSVMKLRCLPKLFWAQTRVQQMEWNVLVTELTSVESDKFPTRCDSTFRQASSFMHSQMCLMQTKFHRNQNIYSKIKLTKNVQISSIFLHTQQHKSHKTNRMRCSAFPCSFPAVKLHLHAAALPSEHN